MRKTVYAPERGVRRPRPRAMKFRVALFRLKLERAWWRFARAALLVFEMPGRIVDLPPGHPYRFLAAQVIL